MPPILSLESVSFRYGGREVFRDLNLHLEEGEILGLVGPNGSGKTTLGKLAGGLLRPQAGRVLLRDRDTARIPRDRLARLIGMVPQITEAPFPFSVEEVVLMGRGPFLGRFGWEGPRDLEVARRAMDLTRVVGLKDRSFSELSGGERQRVLLARALTQEPEILLLDEPTSQLDIRHQAEVLDLIRRLNGERGLTVLHICHDLNMAAERCHRLAILREGAVLCTGPPAAVVTEGNILRVYGAAVAVERNPITGALRVTPGGTDRGG
ncbi:MAG: ABC transporter ATP-binding protein [Deltaproteobacteria bacterium]|nr:ABC transporter ATP-binding protein [Deltaproteobacteria bacterium]